MLLLLKASVSGLHDSNTLFYLSAFDADYFHTAFPTFVLFLTYCLKIDQRWISILFIRERTKDS